MTKKLIVEAKNISKTFLTPTPLTILRDLCLEVEEGTSLAISGKSGEGKSTLLQILGTLEKSSQGSLQICGQSVTKNNISLLRNQYIGFIFQAFHLLEDYTALENVLFPAKIARKDISKGSESYEHALFLLEEMGLTARAHFLVKTLSGGEKQRVAIARALCNDPPLLLADEPSGNLDQANSSAIHQLLINCVKKWKKTLIVVTHDKKLASLCDRELLLENGKLSALTPEEIPCKF
ncbi:MAG: ABC transporter ATP-binding protein [Chlamydiae bacterium]|nr:ABC transporter ATP-binding protein [Chlamydiota bacterium]